MTIEFTIREGSEGDYHRLRPLFDLVDAYHRENRPDIFDVPKSDFRSQSWYMGLLRQENAGVLVAEAVKTSAVLGVAIVRISERKDNVVMHDCRRARIDDLVVDPVMRRRGVARLLIKGVNTWAKTRQCTEIDLTYWHFNRDAAEFYKSLGFQEELILVSRPIARE